MIRYGYTKLISTVRRYFAAPAERGPAVKAADLVIADIVSKPIPAPERHSLDMAGHKHRWA